MTNEELKKNIELLEYKLDEAYTKLEALGRIDEVDYVSMTKDDFKKTLQHQIARKNAIEAMLSDALTAVTKGRRL